MHGFKGHSCWPLRSRRRWIRAWSLFRHSGRTHPPKVMDVCLLLGLFFSLVALHVPTFGFQGSSISFPKGSVRSGHINWKLKNKIGTKLKKNKPESNRDRISKIYFVYLKILIIFIFKTNRNYTSYKLNYPKMNYKIVFIQNI